MLTAPAGNVAPKTRKGRTATVQPLQNSLSISDTFNTVSALRLQRLSMLGIDGARADLISTLAWGVVYG